MLRLRAALPAIVAAAAAPLFFPSPPSVCAPASPTPAAAPPAAASAAARLAAVAAAVLWDAFLASLSPERRAALQKAAEEQPQEDPTPAPAQS